MGFIIFVIFVFLVYRVVKYYYQSKFDNSIKQNGGMEKIFQQLVNHMKEEYPNTQVERINTHKILIGRFAVECKYDYLEIRWFDLKLRYPINKLNIPLNKNLEYLRRESLSYGSVVIVNDHSISLKTCWDETIKSVTDKQTLKVVHKSETKKKNVLLRVKSYEFEDLMYEIFQDFLYYDEKYGYKYYPSLSKPFDRIDIVNRIQKSKKVNEETALSLLNQMIDLRLINRDLRGLHYEMSDFLIYNWDIITDDDDNYNRWARRHNVPKRKLS